MFSLLRNATCVAFNAAFMQKMSLAELLIMLIYRVYESLGCQIFVGDLFELESSQG